VTNRPPKGRPLSDPEKELIKLFARAAAREFLKEQEKGSASSESTNAPVRQA
jgi:hypothetical protein